MRMNKKGDIDIMDLLLWILFGLIIFLLIGGVFNLFNNKKDSSGNSITASQYCDNKCKKECEKFDYTFYKIENCYLRWEKCWCYDENHKPKDIGGIY